MPTAESLIRKRDYTCKSTRSSISRIVPNSCLLQPQLEPGTGQEGRSGAQGKRLASISPQSFSCSQRVTNCQGCYRGNWAQAGPISGWEFVHPIQVCHPVLTCWPVDHDGMYQEVFSKPCYSAGAWSRAPSPHWSFLGLEENQRAGQRKNAHRRWEGKGCCVPSFSTPRGPAQEEVCPHLSPLLQKYALLLYLPKFSLLRAPLSPKIFSTLHTRSSEALCRGEAANEYQKRLGKPYYSLCPL